MSRRSVTERLGPQRNSRDHNRDRDGDLSMKPQPRFSPYVAGPKKTPKILSSEVSINGFEAHVSGKELADFLTSKAQPCVDVLEIRKQADTIYIKLNSPEQATILQKMSGLKFKNKKLFIRFHVSKTTEVTGSIIETLVSLVKARYNADAKFLDLASIHTDPSLMACGLKGFDQPTGKSKFGAVLCKVIQENCPLVETISFASNRMKSTAHLSTLSSRAPHLVNLSLKDNLFLSYRELEDIKGKDFPNLKEILLLGNPIRERELSKPGGDINYKSNVKKLFPSIHMLDMEPVLEEIQFGTAEPTILSQPILPGFMDSQMTAQTTQEFLQSFFTLFDTNRGQLFDFYHESAVFSLSVNPIKHNTPTSFKPFDAWLKHNHNLQKVGQADKRVSQSYMGPVNIVKTFLLLPDTSHPLNEPPEKKRFLVDAFQQQLGDSTVLNIIIHGDFKETKTREFRSFDRSFILIPSPPNSRLPFCIKNDQLVIRPFSGNSAWIKAGIPEQTSQLPDALTLDKYRVEAGLTEQQHLQVIGFSKQTGLNYQFSRQCLIETQWNVANANQAFLNAKPNIPPAAFQI